MAHNFAYLMIGQPEGLTTLRQIQGADLAEPSAGLGRSKARQTYVGVDILKPFAGFFIDF